MARDLTAEAEAVQHMLARARLSIDDTQSGRTCFLSHLGAQERLAPGPWMGHRDLLYGLALANLSPAQRTSLARAILVDHGREFGVGRLRLQTLASGLPLGGSSLLMEPRKGGTSCLYTWALGPGATPATCDWLLLRASPEWAVEPAPKKFSARGVQLLTQLGGEVLLLVDTAVGALQVAQACMGTVRIAAHPRFSPHIEALDPEAAVLLWPHDALDGAGLRRHEVVAVALVDAPEVVQTDLKAWMKRRGGEQIETVDLCCPGRMDRAALHAFWQACGKPAVFLTGDPGWTSSGASWLRTLGADVVVHGEATQLSLL
ncbi:MAG: hypothetical protein ACRBN8_10710 [Nannocystales bacterium]